MRKFLCATIAVLLTTTAVSAQSTHWWRVEESGCEDRYKGEPMAAPFYIYMAILQLGGNPTIEEKTLSSGIVVVFVEGPDSTFAYFRSARDCQRALADSRRQFDKFK